MSINRFAVLAFFMGCFAAPSAMADIVTFHPKPGFKRIGWELNAPKGALAITRTQDQRTGFHLLIPAHAQGNPSPIYHHLFTPKLRKQLREFLIYGSSSLTPLEAHGLSNALMLSTTPPQYYADLTSGLMMGDRVNVIHDGLSNMGIVIRTPIDGNDRTLEVLGATREGFRVFDTANNGLQIRGIVAGAKDEGQLGHLGIRPHLP